MIDRERVLRTFLDYVRIDSETHHERTMTERLAADLRALGLEVCTDQAGKASGVDSDGANVYGFLEGDAGHDSILFSAHMDTVTPGRGIEPIIEDGYVRTRGDTVLGADDKSGVAAIMEALRCLVESGAPHRPVEVVFTIREEGGLFGSANLEYDRIRSKYGVVLDASNDVGKIVTSAPGQIRLYADIYGKRSHAGSDPEKGVSAIQAAAVAVSRMKLQRIDEETTANIGTISAQYATNIVPERAELVGECRSRRDDKLEAQGRHMMDCLQAACDKFGATLEGGLTKAYSAYSYTEDDPFVQELMAACRKAGLEPTLAASGGGSDANNMSAHGLKALVLGTGMAKVHTVQEEITVKNLEDTAALVLAIAAK